MEEAQPETTTQLEVQEEPKQEENTDVQHSESPNENAIQESQSEESKVSEEVKVTNEAQITEEKENKKPEIVPEEGKGLDENVDKDTQSKSKKSLADAARQVMKEMENQSFSNVYEGAILDRKKESFLNFQIRDQQRKERVEIHKGIITAIVNEIDSRLAWVGAGIDKTVKFFKDRATQEEEYMKIMSTGLPKLGAFFKDPTKPELLTNFSKALEDCDEFHLRQSKNSELLAKFLRKEILEKIILNSEKEFKKHYEVLRAPIEEFKKKFVSLSQERAKRQRAYIFAYNEAQRGGKITKEKDMCYTEIENAISGYEESKLIKGYGTQALLLLNETVKLLIKRFTEIQHALTLYFQKYIEIYGYKASDPEGVMQSLQRFNGAEEIQQIFSVKNILTPDSLKYFQSRTGKTEINYQMVFDIFVEMPPPIEFEKGPLILKGWKTQRDAGLLKGTKQCEVIVTIDGHILVIDKASDGDGIDNTFILNLKNLKIIGNEEKKDYSSVEILETLPGLLVNSKTKLLLKFGNADSAEEFRHYVYNYYNTAALEINK